MKIETGKTSFIEGVKFRVELNVPEKKIVPGGTATHEAMHVVAALGNGTGVESATIIPGAGYLGLTKLSKPDAVAAMAPHAMGAGGTGYDVYIAGIIGNAGSAESAARGIINSNMDKVMAVAQKLEENKTLISSDISNVLFELKNPSPEEATLYIENSNREVTEKSVEIKNNTVMIPDEWVNLSKAA